MSFTIARLHAGLLARKGEATPAASVDAVLASGPIRREVPTGPLEQRQNPGRVIQFLQPLCPARNATAQRHLHAKVDPTIHTRLKLAAARLDRTQQSLLTCAIGEYLDFLEREVLPHDGAHPSR